MSPLSEQVKEMKAEVTAELIHFIQCHNTEEFGKPEFIIPFGGDSRCTNWGIRYTDGISKRNLLYLVYDHSSNKWGLSNIMNFIKVYRHSKEDAVSLFKFVLLAIPRVNRYQLERFENRVATDPDIPDEIRPLMLRAA